MSGLDEERISVKHSLLLLDMAWREAQRRTHRMVPPASELARVLRDMGLKIVAS